MDDTVEVHIKKNRIFLVKDIDEDTDLATSMYQLEHSNVKDVSTLQSYNLNI